MKSLAFQPENTFYALLLEIYLNERLIQANLPRTSSNLQAEIELLTKDYFPSLIGGENPLKYPICPNPLDPSYIYYRVNTSGTKIYATSHRSEERDVLFVNANSISRAFLDIDDFIKDFKESKKLEVKLNDEYQAKFNPEEDLVEVGCQKIPVSSIRELYQLIEENRK